MSSTQDFLISLISTLLHIIISLHSCHTLTKGSCCKSQGPECSWSPARRLAVLGLCHHMCSESHHSDSLQWNAMGRLAACSACWNSPHRTGGCLAVLSERRVSQCLASSSQQSTHSQTWFRTSTRQLLISGHIHLKSIQFTPKIIICCKTKN